MRTHRNNLYGAVNSPTWRAQNRREQRRLQEMQELYTVHEVGTCGTCGHDAAATGANEGYSDCCNDRIEYGLEARETRLRVEADIRETIAENRKRIASLASQKSRGKDVGDALENARQWQKRNKAELRYWVKRNAR